MAGYLDGSQCESLAGRRCFGFPGDRVCGGPDCGFASMGFDGRREAEGVQDGASGPGSFSRPPGGSSMKQRGAKRNRRPPDGGIRDVLRMGASDAFGRGTRTEPANPQLKLNPLETLRNFEPSANEEYRLGRGDEITVDFAGRTDLTAKLVVGPDGRITLPLAGDLMLAGQDARRSCQGYRDFARALLHQSSSSGDDHEVHREQGVWCWALWSGPAW